MTPPPTIMAAVLDTRWFRSPLKRRLTFAVAALILVALSLWPRYYEAKAELTPLGGAGGLGALLGQGGGLASLGALLGNHDSIESDLAIGRSHAVLVGALSGLSKADRRRLGDGARAEITLRKKVDVAALRGSILQITTRDRDPAFAQALTAGYLAAIRDRLTILNLQQAAQKKSIAVNRVAQATTRLANAQAAITRFRSENNLAAPELQLGAAVGLLANLQGRLEAKQVQLQAAQQFATPDNIQVKALQAEIAGLRTQIARAQTSTGAQGTPTLATMSRNTAEYSNLYAEEKISEALYQIYTKSLEEITVEELSSSANINVLEPAYVAPERQYNVWAAGLLVLVVVIALTAEFYVIAPPVGRPPGDRHA